MCAPRTKIEHDHLREWGRMIGKSNVEKRARKRCKRVNRSKQHLREQPIGLIVNEASQALKSPALSESIDTAMMAKERGTARRSPEAP